MRKNIERMIGLTLCMGMLAGCAQTPESSLVRQKGNKALDSYKEADDKDVNMAGNASSLIRQLLLKILVQVILLPPLTFTRIMPQLPEPLSAT